MSTPNDTAQNQVYLVREDQPDTLIGFVNLDGKAYEKRAEKDLYIGRADLETGWLYESRLAPDQLAGRVDIESGLISLNRLNDSGPVASVGQDGAIVLALPDARKEAIGTVKELTSLAHGGAAFLLLIKPAMDARSVPEETPVLGLDDLEAGTAPIPAG